MWIRGYEQEDFYLWAIVPKDLNEPIGSISIVRQDNKIGMVHVGYSIGRKWWGKGYTSEALIRLVKFFFEEVGVNRIESRHEVENPNSGKVMEKAGLIYEGTLRQADYSNHGLCDTKYYGILASDYFQQGR